MRLPIEYWRGLSSREGRVLEGADLFGATAVLAGSGPSAAGRPGLPIRLMAGLLYLKHAYNESDESVSSVGLPRACYPASASKGCPGAAAKRFELISGGVFHIKETGLPAREPGLASQA
jgi:hypothetical protein